MADTATQVRGIVPPHEPIALHMGAVNALAVCQRELFKEHTDYHLALLMLNKAQHALGILKRQALAQE